MGFVIFSKYGLKRQKFNFHLILKTETNSKKKKERNKKEKNWKPASQVRMKVR